VHVLDGSRDLSVGAILRHVADDSLDRRDLLAGVRYVAPMPEPNERLDELIAGEWLAQVKYDGGAP